MFFFFIVTLNKQHRFHSRGPIFLRVSSGLTGFLHDIQVLPNTVKQRSPSQTPYLTHLTEVRTIISKWMTLICSRTHTLSHIDVIAENSIEHTENFLMGAVYFILFFFSYIPKRVRLDKKVVFIFYFHLYKHTSCVMCCCCYSHDHHGGSTSTIMWSASRIFF